MVGRVALRTKRFDDKKEIEGGGGGRERERERNDETKIRKEKKRRRYRNGKGSKSEERGVREGNSSFAARRIIPRDEFVTPLSTQPGRIVRDIPIKS